jgi:predicted  nucleic acid-binding Zn-ribbon protein
MVHSVHSVKATYHGEGYGDEFDSYPLTPQRSNSSSNYKPAAHPAGLEASAFNHDDYNSPVEERAGFAMSLNTKVRSQNQDVVSRHLLYETAMLDTNAFQILALEEVEDLKKELTRLHSRIEGAQRKLALESKVKDAAANLQRLYSNDSTRADSPQYPESPRRTRRSLLGGRQRSGSSASNEGNTLSQTGSELATSTRKVDELNETIKSLLERRQNAERKLLRHTAAVLAEQQSKQADETAAATRAVDDDDASIYSPDEFDGIRDILLGKPAHTTNKLQKRGNPQKMQEDHEQQLHSMQARLERLNDQLRNVISEASKTRGVSLAPEQIYNPVDADDATAKLNSDFDRLENNLRVLQQEQQDTQNHYARIQESSYQTRNDVEEQLQGLNTQLHNILVLSPAAQTIDDLEEPPTATGHGYQPQLAYLEECFLNIDQILRRQKELDVDELSKDAGAISPAQSKKLDEYEATIGGLWEIMQAEQSLLRTPPVDEGRFSAIENAPRSPLSESFSLPAFSSRVQHLFNRASSANEQHDILRRQIQQQRELNGKSDAEKDRHVEELTCKHEQLIASGEKMQDELARYMAQHQQAETEASQLKAELLNVENEFAELRRTAELRHQEREEMARQLQAQQERTGHLQQEIQELEAQAANMESGSAKHADLTSELAAANAARQEAEQRHAAAIKEMEQVESEVVRLSTELTMAKAELDAAYGSRAERAKEAKGSEIQVLAERNAEITAELAALRAERGDNSRVNALEHELQAMTGDFQDLTREALQMEHERGQLDSLIDGLRDRVESLEGQLSDERVRWIGVKSPGETAPGERNSALPPIRETTSVMVMRQEFKRMMRETRAEGVRLLKVSGEPNLCTREPMTNNPFRPNKTNVANSRPKSAVSRTAAPPTTTPCLCLRG